MITALRQQRAAHLANVQQVQNSPRKFIPQDADRAERTIATLNNQIAEIDGQIRRLEGRPAL
ncbi:MAG: hypothetical protein CVV07_07245 [Gammaproteobacteria bacterium HGW-Gammaproteobacteria-11]|nr:MAG: hypothetical protein CVV07_07245 [Gammaproteobacteria bacterium HGW-Gammaproteobacteria-11]